MNSEIEEAPSRLIIEQWPIEKLIPYARNPRKNDEKVEKMVAAIKEFGFRIPVVAKSDGSVVDGHLRIKAAKVLGLSEIPVALADELSDAQIKAFRLLANRSANWADWDDELLRLEFEELKALDFNLDLTGFDEDEFSSILAAIDPNKAGGISPEERNATLAERFGIPPFSVFNAREGWWQNRKRAWLSIGIKSEEGRGENLLNFIPTAQLQRKDYSSKTKRGGGSGQSLLTRKS